MSEQIPKSHEGAHKGEQQATNHEREHHNERMRKHYEKATQGVEKPGQAKELQREVEAQAISGAEYHQPQAEQRQQAKPLTKVDKDRGFETIMHQVRNEMSKPEQSFSKVIHHPTVEKASDFMGKTVLRPSGVIGATLAAGIGLVLVYGVAKTAGFGLSGSEVPILLCLGFTIGLFIEWCYKSVCAVFGKNSKK